VQRGLMTEYEWRRAVQHASRARPDWWGAQCLYPNKAQRLLRDRFFHLFLLMLSLVLALMLPLVFPKHPKEVFENCLPAAASSVEARRVSAISYQRPAELFYEKHIFPRAQLLQGKMLLIDENHPLPQDLLPPNTVSIAQYGSGMVPVHSLQLRSGYGTIDALKELFEQLRASGAEGLFVHQGTVSTAQQRQALTQQTRLLMQSHPPEKAVSVSLASLEWPGTGSLLQEYAVEICTADGRPLEESSHGQTLLQLCWRYGFVRESAQRPFRFRYVGKAHATAMTYLDLDFASYLEWLHLKGNIAVSAGGNLQYLILCEPLKDGYAAFDLPECAGVDLSMDNTGYALAACTL